MAGAAGAVRIGTFLLSLVVVSTMAVLSGYVGSRWGEHGGDVGARATFLATGALWLAALVSLGVAARSRRPGIFGASLFLFLLTLVGEVISLVAFTAD